jgi:uncharacterized membrane protein
VVAVLALGLAWLAYRRRFPGLTPTRRRALYALRALAILTVVLLLFRPVLSVERSETNRKGVVVLLDTSASRGTTDGPGGLSRLEQARAKAQAWSSSLSKDFDVDVLTFSDRASIVARPGDLASVTATGAATSLVRALAAASQAVPAGEREAVIVLTDGRHNATGDPVSSARAFGAPVLAVGVGNSLKDSPSYRDVRLAGLDVPDPMPKGNRSRVVAQVAQVGLDGRVVPVVLEQDGQEVARVDAVLGAPDTTTEVALEFVPEVKGRHNFTARVLDQPDERMTRNNARSAAAEVIDAKVRVLYVEGTLRAEYGAIVQRFLSRDPDLEFCALVQTRPNVFARRSNADTLNLDGLPVDADAFHKFDVFIIGDLDRSFWKDEGLKLLSDRVNAGAGLLMLGGSHGLGPGGYGGSMLETILPARLGPRTIGQITEPFVPVLTPAGRAHPILANIARFFPTEVGGVAAAPGLPPLEGCTKVEGPSPGAEVLAVHPGPVMPVLAVMPVGKGRAAVFTGDTTRNWQQVSQALDQESPFVRFWGQLVRWLAGRSDTGPPGPGVTARADRAEYRPDEPMEVTATVRDAEGGGTDKAVVVARVRPPSTTAGASVEDEVALSPVAGATGQYRGRYDPLAGPGPYAIRVSAELAGASYEAEPIAVEVGRSDLEFDRLDLDEALLARMAEVSRGRYRHIATADHLLDELDRKAQVRRVALERPLSEPRLGWALVVVLLAAEWTLRRRYRLR